MILVILVFLFDDLGVLGVDLGVLGVFLGVLGVFLGVLGVFVGVLGVFGECLEGDRVADRFGTARVPGRRADLHVRRNGAANGAVGAGAGIRVAGVLDQAGSGLGLDGAGPEQA
ncbi:hypothetical protein L2E82_30488 [Cichorium intybus]|uniref:Uncharacterized protein n=1 Tax=Cichorium intybus TaxID=13427 RepID=A0ACB9D0H7_CICIN|nr:hypothetical protein L2E82_30488 [Cichorium intybus]